MTMELIQVEAPKNTQAISLDELPVLIGRSPLAKVRLDDTYVSRCHCEIEISEDMLIVRDLGSTHGTHVNGQAIIQAPLRPGDTLTIGRSTFKAVGLPNPRRVARSPL